jgi:phosphate transport system protein
MCALAGAIMKQTTEVSLEADINTADHVQMVVRRARAESDAFGLLALEQPVAGELREIVSSIQIMADAERMGALAVRD